MARPRQRAQARHQYNRTDRISETIREIVATQLERLGDERVELVTVTGVTVDNDLNVAKIFYSALVAESENRLDEVPEALAELRWPIQQIVNRSIRARKTPQIEFHTDEVLAAALRIDDILNNRVFPAGESVAADSTAEVPAADARPVIGASKKIDASHGPASSAQAGPVGGGSTSDASTGDAPTDESA